MLSREIKSLLLPVSVDLMWEYWLSTSLSVFGVYVWICEMQHHAKTENLRVKAKHVWYTAMLEDHDNKPPAKEKSKPGISG